MDIVVTLPINRGGMFHLYEKQEEPSYWSMKRKPQNISKKDKVFICTEGKIHGFFLIDNYEIDFYTDDFIINFKDNSWTEIIPIKTKGFQGFRYRKFDYEVEK